MWACGRSGESSGSRQSRQGHNQERLLYVKELGFLPSVVMDFKLNNDTTSIALGKTRKNCLYVIMDGYGVKEVNDQS